MLFLRQGQLALEFLSIVGYNLLYKTSHILCIQCFVIPIQMKTVSIILIIGESLIQEMQIFVFATFVSDEFVDTFDFIVQIT